jgi:hypothetical protein
MADSDPRRQRWLAQPFEAGMTGFIVVFGAILAELIGGAVTNRMSTSVVVPVLAVPAAIALGFAFAQWWQVRSSGAEPASWWHLAGIAAGLIAWVLWPTKPGVLEGTGSAFAACNAMGSIQVPGCLQRAAQALDSHNVAWWGTAALIVAMALLVRRSRIAAWAAIPVAFAGCELATHFMEQLLLFYNAGG